MMVEPKSTSYQYGRDCQMRLLEKYKNRNDNHWKIRIELANRLVEQYVFPQLEAKPKSDTVVVDIGCSIGTFAIEFAKRGYKSYGIDFDPAAIEIATHLAADEGVSPEFVCGDVSDWTSASSRPLTLPSVLTYSNTCRTMN